MGINPVFFVIGCVLFLLCAAGYVLTAWPMYAIAKRRGIAKAWLAWVPIGNNWILGCIADHYHLNVHYTTKSSRKVLLVLSVVVIVFSLLLLLWAAVVVHSAMKIDLNAFEQHGYYIDFLAPVRENIQSMLWIYVILIMVVCIHGVTQYMALFHVYRSCDPQNCVLMIILSIVFGICIPICLLCTYKQDAGFPTKGKSCPV